MDSSEHCVHNNDLNPEDSPSENFDVAMRHVDGSPLVGEEHVLGILEIQDSADPQATLILQPDGLTLDGQHIYIERSGLNGEYFVVVRENSSEEGSEVVLNEHYEEKLELNNDEDSLAENRISSTSEQQLDLPCDHPDNSQNEDTFNPTSSDSSIVDSHAEAAKHGKLLHLAVVAQELQSADANYSMSQHAQEFQCSQSIPEDLVIVTQIHADSDSALCQSREAEISSIDLANEQDSHSSIGEVSADVEVETPTVERKTSFSCISSSRCLDNTVSVIHTTSSTYIQNDLGKGVESSYITDVVSIAKSDKSEDSVAALQVNISHDDCSNPNDNFSNHNEDSVLSQNEDSVLSQNEDSVLSQNKDSVLSQNKDSVPSQNCVLDKESNLDDPICDNDSFPTVGHSRSRYGIMDSLNKEKQNPFHDTYTSGDIEDTNHSSSRSTNITDDNESASENNSNQMECNKSKEIVVENNASSEVLSAENTNLIAKCSSTNVVASSDGDSDISQDFKTSCEEKLTNQGDSELQSFNLPSNDNSESKSSAFSDNAPSPSLLTKDSNLVKKRGRPSRTTKKAMDAYEFDDASAEKDQHIYLPESEANLEEGIINSGISASKISHSGEVVEEESALKLTFHEALSSVLEKEESKKTHCTSINSNQSANVFDNESEAEENNDLCDNQEEITISNNKSVISKQEDNHNRSENAFVENIEAQNVFDNSCSNIENAEENLQMPSQKILMEGKDTDYDLVKPPKKTYNRKKKSVNDFVKFKKCDGEKDKNDIDKVISDKDRIELFSYDDLSITKDNKNPFCVDSQKDTDSTCEDQIKEFGMDDDGMESNVQSKVSATYKRKRKNVPPIVRANRTRSLRKRFSKAIESEEDEEEEDSSLRVLEEQLNSQVTGNVNEQNWGHILLGTKFSSEPSSTNPSMISSTVPSSSSPSRNRKRPAWFTTPNSNKSQLTSGKQFDKLIKSSPSKVKCRTSNEKKKLRDKIKKQAMSLCNNLLPSLPHTNQKRGRPKTKVSKEPYREVTSESNSTNLKRCVIKYLCERPVGSNRLTSSVPDSELIYCSNNCGFVCPKIDNLIYHRKSCSSEFDSNDLEDSSKLFCDMDKRQRIRGETKNKEKECNGSSMDWQEPQPSCSKTYQRKCSDKEKHAKHDHRKKYGFAERDIVWFKRGRQYWPALAWGIHNEEALFYIITAPNQCEAKTIQVHLLKKYIHSFDDVEWSRRILAGTKKANKNTNYIKAVQKANSYIQKKVLFGSTVDAKKFFDIKDDNERSKTSGSSESEMETENVYESPFIENTNEEIDVSKVLECIFRGDCDKHIVSIYLKEVPSQRHGMFFSEEHEVAQQLEDMSWFGPFKTDASMQLELYDHFYELYKRTIEGAPNVSYIYKVWIPEGIIKAISLVKRISMMEAELIFLRQEIQSRMPYDPLEGISSDSSPLDISPDSSPMETSQMMEASP